MTDEQRDTSKPKVLVVDDNSDAADTLALLLELDGFAVEKAYDGRQALEAVERFRPQLVILDIDMPGLSGIEVARRLKEDRRRYVLIALSAQVSAPTSPSLREAGFDIEISKPAEPTRLTQLLASLS